MWTVTSPQEDFDNQKAVKKQCIINVQNHITVPVRTDLRKKRTSS